MNNIYLLQRYNFSSKLNFFLLFCSHFSMPSVPNIRGMDEFEGCQLHSHCYRRNHRYKNRRVLVIGSGPSGRDISVECAEVAKKVSYTHYHFQTQSKTFVRKHNFKFFQSIQVYLCCGREMPKTEFHDNVVKKHKVLCLKKQEVHFCDGTIHQIDDIIYCTGKYSLFESNEQLYE